MLLGYQRKSLYFLRALFIAGVLFFSFFLIKFLFFQLQFNKYSFLTLFCSGVLAAFAAGALFLRAHLWNVDKLWFLVLLYSCALCSIIVALLLSDYYLSDIYNLTRNTPMLTPQETEVYINNAREQLSNRGVNGPISVISTGCLIQWLEISPTGELRVIGYVWQKFSTYTDQEIFFVDAVEQKITKAYQFMTDDKQEVIGWHFVAKFIAEYKYTKYPLDAHTLIFTFGHKNFNNNTIFVPDFDSYPQFNTEKKIGILPDCELLNWTIKASDFSYYWSPYTATYGLNAYALQPKLPQLSLSVLIKRNYTFLLLYCLTPLIVAFFILFSLTLFIGAKKLKLSEDIVIYISAIFFAIIMAHDLYKKTLPELAAAQYTYVDYLFLICYFYSFLVCLDGMFYYGGYNKLPLVRSHNKAFRLLYWPFLLTCVLIGTFAVFY